jgi:hypothetical protein
MLTMDLRDLDATLARLHAAADAIGTNLLELEADPTYQVLEHATLEGASAEQWESVRAVVVDLWHWYTLLTAVVTDADTRRRTRVRPSPADEAELSRLLTGTSIELGRRRIPVGQRSLLTFGQSTTTCTPDDLLGTMADAFGQVQLVVNRIGTVWDELVPRLAAVREQVLAAGELAPLRELAAAQATLDELAQRILANPVTVTEDEVTSLELEVRALRDGAAHLATTRASRRDELRGRLAAYQVMAFALGRAEDPATSAAYDAAHAELYRVPTDLDAAERRLRQYQDLLSPTDDSPGGRR